jgi:hypothetical protein
MVEVAEPGCRMGYRFLRLSLPAWGLTDYNPHRD